MEHRAQVGAGQSSRFRGLTLQFRCVKNQTEAVDLLGAFTVDLPQPVDHDGGQVPATQQTDNKYRRMIMVRRVRLSGRNGSGPRRVGRFQEKPLVAP